MILSYEMLEKHLDNQETAIDVNEYLYEKFEAHIANDLDLDYLDVIIHLDDSIELVEISQTRSDWSIYLRNEEDIVNYLESRKIKKDHQLSYLEFLSDLLKVVLQID